MLEPSVCPKQLRAVSPTNTSMPGELIHLALFSSREQYEVNFTLYRSREQCLHCSLDRVRPSKKMIFFKNCVLLEKLYLILFNNTI